MDLWLDAKRSSTRDHGGPRTPLTEDGSAPQQTETCSSCFPLVETASRGLIELQRTASQPFGHIKDGPLLNGMTMMISDLSMNPHAYWHDGLLRRIQNLVLSVALSARKSGILCCWVIPATIGILSPTTVADEGAAGDHYLEVIYDLTGVAYTGGPASPIANLQIDEGSRVMGFRWENVVLETHLNAGVPNWGNEAFFGLEGIDVDGAPVSYLAQPFPFEFGQGVFGPVDGSLELEMADLFAHPDGTIDIVVGSTWDDGSGMPAGTYLAGSLMVDYLPIPAPAATALLAFLALYPGRRRT